MKVHRAWWPLGCGLALLGAGDGGLVWAQPDRDADQAGTGQASNEVASGATALSPGRLDLSSFRIITDRNIFDGNRSGQRITSTRSSSRQRSVQVDWFSLVGTLVSSKESVAFFDGSEEAFRKVLKPGEAVAGYRVSEILPAGVRLAEGTNIMDLCVGNGMRREDGGGWRLALGTSIAASGSPPASSRSDSFSSRRSGERGRSRDRGTSYSGNSGQAMANDASTTDPPSASDVNEVLKRLMEQREKETQ